MATAKKSRSKSRKTVPTVITIDGHDKYVLKGDLMVGTNNPNFTTRAELHQALAGCPCRTYRKGGLGMFDREVILEEGGVGIGCMYFNRVNANKLRSFVGVPPVKRISLPKAA